MATDVKAVLFDLDDTLYDRDKAQREILRVIVQEFPDLFTGIDEERMVDAFIESDLVAVKEYNAGNHIDEVRVRRTRNFLKNVGLSEKGKDYVNEITTIYLIAYPTLNVPIEGTKSVLENLAEKFQLGIVSNGSLEVQFQKLITLNIKYLFNCIILSEEVGIRKPDPRIFLKAANSLAREPKECLHIGDSYDADILGAKNAGIRACWFNPRGLPLSQDKIKPDFEIGSLNEIPNILGIE